MARRTTLKTFVPIMYVQVFDLFLHLAPPSQTKPLYLSVSWRSWSLSSWASSRWRCAPRSSPWVSSSTPTPTSETPGTSWTLSLSSLGKSLNTGRGAAKLGRWVAKLVTHLLAMAALWVRIQTFLKKIQNGRHKQRCGQPKNIKKS